MNLREFTEKTDQLAKKMDQEQLFCFVHSITRKVPEEARESFLEIMNRTYCEMTGSENDAELKGKLWEIDEQEICAEFDRLAEMFGKIEEEELTLQADGYEDYSSGYWGSDWVWEYSDPEGICQIYADGCKLIRRCADDGFYQKAVEMFDLVMGTEVSVENDWDWFSLDLDELDKEDLLEVDLQELVLYVLYAAYQAAEPEERAPVLYGYFSLHCFKDVHIENMLSMGREELKGLPQFWKSWIALLSEKNGDIAMRLLKEAVLYQKGEGGLLDVARVSYRLHPSVYLETLVTQEKNHDIRQQLETGKEALDKIDRKYRIRSQIALKTAEAALQLDMKNFAEECWIEAFRSDTSPMNYLRIVNESAKPEQYEAGLREIISTSRQNNGSTSNIAEELRENVISPDQETILCFLTGNFDAAMEKCAEIKKSLGWTGTFMKCGLSLLLLLLVKENTWHEGCMAMAGEVQRYMGFQVKEYFQGTRRQIEYMNNSVADVDEAKVFRECFISWKSRYRAMYLSWRKS